MKKREEYLKNLRTLKWVRREKSSYQNCEHSVDEHLTCGEYEGGVVWLTPQGSGLVPVPEGYSQRSGLWICPKHISNYELTN